MPEAAEIIERALNVPLPECEKISLVSARRQTGPGMLWDRPGAVLDVKLDRVGDATIRELWAREARRVLDAIGWRAEGATLRLWQGGASLAISAPIDQLYSAVFAAQTAWHFCASEIAGVPPGDFSGMVDDLVSVMKREANPALIALARTAGDRGLEILADEDHLSLGHGAGSRTWPLDNLPDPVNIEWDQIYNLPLALITGTNGKTTTTRLCAAIAKASGVVSGLTSTEFVRVGDDILDRGDYSGPGGARMVLRDRRLEIGLLEVARGGIMRRGLAVRNARVAAVTNVAADHLGHYGINTVGELAAAKFAVGRALAADGVMVLNADDAHVRQQAANVAAPVWWFALDPDTAQIRAAVRDGTPCGWLENDALVLFDGRTQDVLMAVADIPITMRGAARYNIQNALAAALVSKALGVGGDAIRRGLAGFRNDPRDNPGRCNEFAWRGARLFVDFAHNPHSIAAVVSAMAAIPAKRRFALIGHAGDRSDQDIRDLADTVFQLDPDFIAIAEIERLLRGREIGEIPKLLRDACAAQGMADDQLMMAESSFDGVSQILARIEPGDMALLLVYSERERIFELLEAAPEAGG